MLKLYNLKPLWLILFILWTVLLTVVSVCPDSNKVIISTDSGFRWDYLEHFVAYLIFGGLYILWRSRSDFTLKGLEMAMLIAITCIFSILTEYVQILIQDRTFNVMDMAFNVGGVLASILLTYFIIIRLFLRRKFVNNQHD